MLRSLLLLVAATSAAAFCPALLPTSSSRSAAVQMSMVSRRDTLLLGASFAPLVLASSPALAEEAQGNWAEHQGPFSESEFADFKSTASGLKYKDVVQGTGESPPEGKSTVRVHYAGYLPSGSLFDTSYRPALFPFSLRNPYGPPMAFKLGERSVVPGFEEGLAGMKVGGKRIVYFDSSLGYGKAGAGPIPGDSPLIFFLELRSIGAGMAL